MHLSSITGLASKKGIQREDFTRGVETDGKNQPNIRRY